MSDLVCSPANTPNTFLNFPLALDLDSIDADIAILGVPYGKPYHFSEIANPQSLAPDAIRHSSQMVDYTRNHYDWDLGGPLLDGRDIKVVDCGNVTIDSYDPQSHYDRAAKAAAKIFSRGAVLITLGGDHGIPIPVLKALEHLGKEITLIQIDAHIDWRDHVNDEPEGYSSPIRRASEMPWINEIYQIGIRGIGSARDEEVQAALDYGANIVTAYELHDSGTRSVLDRIPDDGLYYITIDADGLDPSIMPAVMAQTPGGLNWIQTRELIHGLVNKGRVAGLDLVEIAPEKDVGGISMIHAERILCNFIGATVRAGYF